MAESIPASSASREQPLPLQQTLRPAVNLRSVALGLLGVMLIGALTPFNDYVLNNTFLIGGSMPLGVMLFLFLVVVFLNGPLSRWQPQWALGSHELAVVLTMTLVACIWPASGLMRFWQPSLVGVWYHATASAADFEKVLEKLDLPKWFWTDFGPAKELPEKIGSGVIQYFYNSLPSDDPYWNWRTIARAWVPPTLGWGAFFLGLFGSLLGISFILRRQWVENERIAFPIAQVQMGLIESPSPGRYLNATLASRAFWIAFIAILALRTIIGLQPYFKRNIPMIWMNYDFAGIWADPPWSYLEEQFKRQTLYPLVAAIMFFASTRISFSLWFCQVLLQIPILYLAYQGADLASSDRRNLQLGAIIAFFAMILWTGRHHYGNVLRLMFWKARPGEDTGKYLPDRAAGWMALLGAALAIVWLMQIRMTFIGAFLLVGGLVMIWVVMANVVAHSGLLAAYTLTGPREWFDQWWFRNLDAKNPSLYRVTDVGNQFGVQLIGGIWAYSTDQLPTYATHGLRVCTEYAPRAGRRIAAAIILSLVVGFFVAHASTLACYYNYANTADRGAVWPINREVLGGQPMWATNYTIRVHREGLQPRKGEKSHLPLLLGGTALTGGLAFAQRRYAWWPLHPIGLLMLFSWPIKRVSASIFLGWAVKVLIVKFGGASLFKAARPFFLGIIIGEVVAAGLFGGLSILLYLLNVQYNVSHFLPVSQF